MSNEMRGTTELVLTRSKATIVLYEYITGRDKRDIQRVYMEQAKISSKMEGKDKKSTVEVGGVSASVNELMEDKAIQCVIKAVIPRAEEGATMEPVEITDKQKVKDFVLDLPAEDYDEVIKAINAITDPKA